MKRKYKQPLLEVTEFRFSERIAGSSTCVQRMNDWDNDGNGGCDHEVPYDPPQWNNEPH